MTDFTLREWKPDDAEALYRSANNPNVAKNLRNAFPNPYTLEDAKEYIHCSISAGEEKQINRAIIVNGMAAGGIGIFIKDDVMEKSGELGYWLSEDYWRQGIMSRAVAMICKEAFSKYDIIRIFAEPYDYNAGSRGVLEKNGFTYEGTMRKGIYKNGNIYSYCMYSLLREEMEI